MNYACDWLGGLSHPWGVRTSITDSTDSRVAGTDRTEAAKKRSYRQTASGTSPPQGVVAMLVHQYISLSALS